MAELQSFTIAEIAAQVGGRVEGDGERRIVRVAALSAARGDSLSWLGHPKYAGELVNTQAAGVLVPDVCDVPAGLTVIRVADPDVAMITVLNLLMPVRDRVEPGIHATAVIAPGARIDGTAAIGPHVVVGGGASIGENSQLHSGVFIGESVSIGRDCVLWPNVVIREGTIIGDRVVIHPNSTIGADGFGYLQRDGRHVKVPQIGVVHIEDDVEIGANTCVDRAKSGVTRIGRGTKIDNLVQIAHNVEIGPHCIIVALSGLGGSTVLGEQAILAGSVGISDHVRIGSRAMVAAKAGVMRDVPDDQCVAGIPAVEARQFWRRIALLAELPEWKRELNRMMERISKLESPTDDRT